MQITQPQPTFGHVLAITTDGDENSVNRLLKLHEQIKLKPTQDSVLFWGGDLSGSAVTLSVLTGNDFTNAQELLAPKWSFPILKGIREDLAEKVEALKKWPTKTFEPAKKPVAQSFKVNDVSQSVLENGAEFKLLKYLKTKPPETHIFLEEAEKRFEAGTLLAVEA